MKITFTRDEACSIAAATGVLSVAFGIALSGGLAILTSPLSLLSAVIVSFIAVGIGFIAHELVGHKFTAQKFGYHAEFRMWPQGLLLALVFSFAGFVFAAPGAVVIQKRHDLWGRGTDVTKKKMGIIAAAGPLVNLALAGIFLVLAFLFPVQILGLGIFGFAVTINIWLGLFNMIPFPPLDGSKVFRWRKDIWAALFAVLAAALVLL